MKVVDPVDRAMLAGLGIMAAAVVGVVTLSHALRAEHVVGLIGMLQVFALVVVFLVLWRHDPPRARSQRLVLLAFSVIGALAAAAQAAMGLLSLARA